MRVAYTSDKYHAPGMVKWIGLAGGYGHLRHLGTEWQPVPSDRWVRCDFEKVNERS